MARQFPFLKLSPEIRDMVYHHALVTGGRVNVCEIPEYRPFQEGQRLLLQQILDKIPLDSFDPDIVALLKHWKDNGAGTVPPLLQDYCRSLEPATIVYLTKVPQGAINVELDSEEMEEDFEPYVIDTALLQVNHQVRDEASRIFFGRNTFFFGGTYWRLKPLPTRTRASFPGSDTSASIYARLV